jgi:L-amino acid N-acyltransferase YncA
MANKQHAKPGDKAIAATLLDGGAVTIRRLQSEDYDGVVALAIDLDDEERYYRFFTMRPAYIAEWASSLTAPAPGIVALGAFDCGDLVGVANYAELAAKPGYAEIAVVVAHGQHARGVGTVLLQQLGRIARKCGQHVFVADVLVDNYPMRRVIIDAGWPATFHRDGPVLSVKVHLDDIDGNAERGRAATL